MMFSSKEGERRYLEEEKTPEGRMKHFGYREVHRACGYCFHCHDNACKPGNFKVNPKLGVCGAFSPAMGWKEWEEKYGRDA